MPLVSGRAPWGRIRWVGWLLAWSVAGAAVWGAVAQSFELPAGQAVKSLNAFSRLSGLEIIYRVEEVRGVRTRELRGRFEPAVALAFLLRDTGLEAVKDAESDAFVGRPSVGGGGGDAGAGRRLGAGAAGAGGALAAGRDGVLELSPFEVRSRADHGYHASNSVSATRMAVPASRLPMTVTIFPRDFIEDQHAYDLYDIVKWAPGVHQDNVSPQGWVRYNVRGFTRAAVQRNGFGSYRFIDTTNIERVEVVKGPASLLYGQINPGGVINYITKRPEARPRTAIDLAAGSHGFTRAVLDTTGPLPVPGREGAFFGRLIAMTETLPEFRELSTGRKRLLAPSLTWRGSDALALTLDYEHFERLDDMPTSGVVLRYENLLPQLPYGPLPDDFSYAGEGDYQDFISDAFTAELDARLGEHLSVRAAYLASTWDMEWRATGQGGTGLLRQSSIDRYYPPSAQLTPADAMFRRNRWEHQWGGERSAQLDVVGDASLGAWDVRALVGAKRNFTTYQHSQQRNNPNVAGSPHYLKPWDLRDPSTWDRRVPFGLEALVPAADTEAASNANSAYGVLTLSSGDGRLRVLAGYARHELHNDPTRDHLKGTETPRTDRAADVPQVGASLEVAPGVSLFASYSESFLANSNMLRIDNVPALPAEPSIGRGGEIGFKADLWDGRFSGSLSFYEIRAHPSDIITVTTGLAPDGTTLFSDLQGGSQRSRGTEVDLLFLPARDWQVLAALSVIDAIYVRHPTVPNFNGAPLVATPDATFSVWTKYAPVEGPLAGLTLAGGLNYVGALSHVGNNPLVRLDSHLTADVSVGYRFGVFGRPLDAELTVKNLADERYFASASSWGFPRQVILSMRLTF